MLAGSHNLWEGDLPTVLSLVQQSLREDAHAKAHLDIQGAFSFPGIRMEIFSSGLSASEGSGGGNQETRQSGPCHGRRRSGHVGGEHGPPLRGGYVTLKLYESRSPHLRSELPNLI